jgi:hypothetical protein
MDSTKTMDENEFRHENFSAAKSGAIMFEVEQSSESVVRLDGRSGMIDDEIRMKNERFS